MHPTATSNLESGRRRSRKLPKRAHLHGIPWEAWAKFSVNAGTKAAPTRARGCRCPAPPASSLERATGIEPATSVIAGGKLVPHPVPWTLVRREDTPDFGNTQIAAPLVERDPGASTALGVGAH